MATVAASTCGLFIDSQWGQRDKTLPVCNKHTGEVIGYVAWAGRDDVERAVAAAHRVYQEIPLPPYRRYAIFKRASEQIRKRRKPGLVRTIAAEAAKPLKEHKEHRSSPGAILHMKITQNTPAPVVLKEGSF